MGDISGQQSGLASISKDDIQSASHSLTKTTKPGHGTLPSNDAATPVEAAGAVNTPVTSRDRSASDAASPLPHVDDVVPGTAPNASDYDEALNLPPALTQMISYYTQPGDSHEPEVFPENPSGTGTGEHFVKLSKGEGRRRSSSEPAKPVSHFSPQTSDNLPGVHSALSTPRSCTVPRSVSSKTTSNSVREAKQIYSVNEGYDDYPHIHDPRSTTHRGRLPYEPRQSLPRPRHMRSHRHVTSYAGEPLFRLCSSVPYVLGSLALITRLQLIVETPILLPDEVKELVAERGIDIASLDSYDLALLNVLCCLWNDWEPSPYQKSEWLTAGLVTKSTEEPMYTDHRLELYFLRRHAVVHRRYCNVLEFIIHMRRWRLVPNPARVLDYDGDSITWRHIVDRLGQLEIDFRRLDGQLYEELRACESNYALTTKLLEIKELQDSGVLDQRYKHWQDQGDRIVDGQLKEETDRMYPTSLNNMRFSHRHPLGVDVNDPEADPLELAANGDTPISRAAVKSNRPLEAQAKRTCWGSCMAGPWHTLKRWFQYPAWRYIIFPFLVFVPFMGGLVYMWLQEEGCGDRCLDRAKTE